MEREIANVAAACAMRGFRYMAFPPIVFDAPMIAVQAPEWVAPAQGAATKSDALGALPPAVQWPSPASPRQALPAESALRPQAALPSALLRDLVAAPLAAASRPPSPAAAPALPQAPPAGRRFALLADVAAQLRQQAPP